jgi:outer membrane protein OmpA-like peptidoglycan-associated protein
MNSNARKVHRTLVGFGVACAVAAALPCVAGDAPAAMQTVTVQGQSIPPDLSTPDKTPDKDKDKDQGQHKGAPAEENIGFFSGLAIGAVAGGPIGAVVGGVTGALLGEHYHKQKVANQELAVDLSGSNADKAKLTQTVLQLDGTLQATQQQQVQLSASVDQARELTTNIGFRTGDAHLTVDDIDQLTTLGKLAVSLPGVKIRVSGHTDPRGSPDYTATLSQDRAESVAAVLENAGLNKDRIVIEALGAKGADETGNLDDYAFQRRVSVKLISEAGDVASVAQPASATVASVE